MDTRESIEEKKMIIFSEHDGGLNKKKSSTIEESVGNLSRSLRTPHARVPQVDLLPSQRFARERGQESDSSYLRSNKKKRTKVYHSLLMTYRELLPVLI